jgi:hypothetical protein
MMLRASIQESGAEYGLDGVIGEGDGGIPHGELLIAFAEAAIGDDAVRLASARKKVLDVLGPEKLVDSAAVIATFNAIDRVADATGTPIDAERVEPSADLRSRLGIDRFPSAVTS